LKIYFSHSFFSLFLLDLASVEIDEKDIQLLNAIGKGQFGKVYRGLWKGLQVAVKEIEKGMGNQTCPKLTYAGKHA